MWDSIMLSLYDREKITMDWISSPAGDWSLVHVAAASRLHAARRVLAYLLEVPWVHPDICAPQQLETPLMMALWQGSTAAVSMLIAAGASVHARTVVGDKILFGENVLWYLFRSSVDVVGKAKRLLSAPGFEWASYEDWHRAAARSSGHGSGMSPVLTSLLERHYRRRAWLSNVVRAASSPSRHILWPSCT